MMKGIPNYTPPPLRLRFLVFSVITSCMAVVPPLWRPRLLASNACLYTTDNQLRHKFMTKTSPNDMQHFQKNFCTIYITHSLREMDFTYYIKNTFIDN